MRTSNDELSTEGVLVNGYDYHRQCWVFDGLYAPCGHTQKKLGMCWSCGHAGEAYTVPKSMQR